MTNVSYIARNPLDVEELRADVAGSVSIPGNPDWDEVRLLLVDSYRKVAPKKLVAQLEAGL